MGVLRNKKCRKEGRGRKDPLFIFIIEEMINFRKGIAEILRLLGLTCTKKDLKTAEKSMNQRLKEFQEKINEQYRAQNEAHGLLLEEQQKANTALEGISGDVNRMKALIEKFQSTPGSLTPEDEEILNNLERTAGEATQKLRAVTESFKATTTRLQAIDDANVEPPTVPDVDPGEGDGGTGDGGETPTDPAEPPLEGGADTTPPGEPQPGEEPAGDGSTTSKSTSRSTGKRSHR